MQLSGEAFLYMTCIHIGKKKSHFNTAFIGQYLSEIA